MTFRCFISALQSWKFLFRFEFQWELGQVQEIFNSKIVVKVFFQRLSHEQSVTIKLPKEIEMSDWTRTFLMHIITPCRGSERACVVCIIHVIVSNIWWLFQSAFRQHVLEYEIRELLVVLGILEEKQKKIFNPGNYYIEWSLSYNVPKGQ